MAASVDVAGLEHAYGTHPVVRGMSFSLAAGGIGCLLGPSGCGKTTVLRCLAGFEPVRAGTIALSGRVVSSTERVVPPEARGIGMVFQDYALFPHLDVMRNVAFGLGKAAPAERDKRTRRMLELVGLADAGGAYPHELSGGQQQRVALARALAPEPELLLLDEPFSNLDVDLRERLSVEVRAILKDAGITAILVTHDQHEAFAIADEVGVMTEGRIEQWDTAYDIYHRPRTRFVADFIGQGVFVRGVATAAGASSPSSASCRPSCPTGSAPATRSTCCCGPTTSCTTTRARGARPCSRRRSAAPSSSTRSRSRPAPACWRSCPRIMTTRSARASASASRSTTSSRSAPRAARKSTARHARALSFV
jgi:iron(III) transport system ATP-binding protein